MALGYREGSALGPICSVSATPCSLHINFLSPHGMPFEYCIPNCNIILYSLCDRVAKGASSTVIGHF